MPSGLVIGATIGAGAILGAFAGHKYASTREDFDDSDKLGFTGSSAIAGAGLVVGGNEIYKFGKRLGITGQHLASASKYAGKGLINGTRMVKQGLLWNPIRSQISKGTTLGKTLSRLGIAQGFKSAGKAVKMGGVLAGVGSLAALAVIASPGGNYQSTAIAESDQMGDSSYTPASIGMTAREKMGLIGATGDMVFGLNNSRHG